MASLINFEAREYLSPIREFLESYPALEPFEQIEIVYQEFDPFKQIPVPQGAGALAVAGSNTVRMTKDIVLGGYRELEFQDNYRFVLRRWARENELRRDANDFLRNYVRWINMENAYRNTPYKNPLLPQFSNFNNIEELFMANGEMPFGLTEDGVDEFQIQIQIRYKLEYKEWL